MFGFGYLKSVLGRLGGGISSAIDAIFGKTNSRQETLAALEKILLESDLGSELTKSIIDELSANKNLNSKTATETVIGKFESILSCKNQLPEKFPKVVMLVGVNGVGKTTFAAKFAGLQKTDLGRRVQLVAADTFRAAAGPQLEQLANKFGVEIFMPEKQSDPASVIFDGCQKFIDGEVDSLVVDTAGRLHSKANLIKELQKCRSILNRRTSDKASLQTWLVLDSTLGQANFEQTQIFLEAVDVDAIVLTKVDSACRGGSIVAVCHKLGRPVVWTSIGDQSGTIEPLDPRKFAEALLQ